jgi:hypothetical protein
MAGTRVLPALLFVAAACSSSPTTFFDEPLAQGGSGGELTAGSAGTDAASSAGGSAGAALETAGAAGAESDVTNDEGGSGGAEAGSTCVSELVFEGRCYAASAEILTWAAAKAACEALGAHLATIGSEAENEFVWALFDDEVWLGAADGKGESDEEPGTYTWVTGEPMAYANWTEGQPNAVGTDCPGDEECYEHCAFAWQGGEWNDRYCGHEIAYVCEWE